MTRKENIRAILECYFTGFKDVIIDSACERIYELEQEPCDDDVVSREAVIEKLKKEDKVLYTTTGLNYLIRVIEELPPVTQKSETVTEFADRCRECGAKYGKLLEQKSGKWIAHSGGGIWVKYYECSECGQGHNTHSDYCPNCGAKMESDNNE